MLKILRLTWVSLQREMKALEWLIIFLALTLAIATITSLHFYTSRIKSALVTQSARFLGGDLALVSAYPIAPAIEKEAQRLHLKTATVLSFASMVSANGKMQMVTIQAVTDNYPLIGHFNLPSRQHVFAEVRTLNALQLNPLDYLKIGTALFKIERIFNQDINTLNTGFMIAPRLLMRLADVADTHTILPGSRVEYRLLMTGEENNLKQFTQYMQKNLQPHQRLLTVKSAQAFLANALSQFENYLNLILLVALLLAGIAIFISSTEYLRRHFSYAALWRALGASSKQLTSVMLIQLVIIAAFASLLGCGLGYLSQKGFEYLFQASLPFTLPSASFNTLGLGVMICFLLLFACTLPLIQYLPRTSPLILWRESTEVYVPKKSSWLLLIGCAVICILLFLDYSLQSLFLLDLLLISMAFLYALALLYLKLINKLMNFTTGIWRQGLSQLSQQANSFSMQFVAFSLILLALLFINAVKNEIIVNWQDNLPLNTPNIFAFNMSEADVPRLQNFLSEKNIPVEAIYPMVRGRLVSLNDEPILFAVPEEARGHNALHRELNLSFMLTPPSDNKIVQGKAFTAADIGKKLVSVEANLAKDLNLKLGDKLTFQIGDVNLSTTVANFRSLQWSSFHPNFFIIFPPKVLTNFPSTYITSFHLAQEQLVYLTDLLNMLPNITIIDVAILLAQINNLIIKMIYALQFLFFLCALLGILIFLASYQTTRQIRLKNAQLLHLLGANRAYIYRSKLIEFVMLFLLIGVSAMVLAYTGQYFVIRTFFNL